ncbi:MAG: lysine--tRNA ligase [Bacteriovoracaceae bacterium]|nr:lysine--tRNA ligase [Bacteriovoracaceae bacterium]
MNSYALERIKKITNLRDAGINPYPYSFDKTISAEDFNIHYSFVEIGTKGEQVESLAGRVMAIRKVGKAYFLDVQDQWESLQVYLKCEEIPPRNQLSLNNLDIGDFVGVRGVAFRTKLGELSLYANELIILSKGLTPLPEKFHGPRNMDLRLKNRHLDLIANQKSKETFITRSKIISGLRNFLEGRGFIEVETPILQPIYGGASARPFSTHHSAFNTELFMKISPELYLKKLVVGGFEKVFEIGKSFRNEGVDRTHNPEFTMLEWYEAYTDYNYQIQQFESLITGLVQATKGTLVFNYQGRELNFSLPWRRLSVYEGVRQYTMIDPDIASCDEVFAELQSFEKNAEQDSKGKMVMRIFELAVEPHLWQPTFVTDHPVEVSPLAKSHRQHRDLVERFEPFVAGMEIGNSYSELNDPVEQRIRLEDQQREREFDSGIAPLDESFLSAIDTAMPPTSGVGLGIDRLVMLLTDSPSIRDVILFPQGAR